MRSQHKQQDDDDDDAFKNGVPAPPAGEVEPAQAGCQPALLAGLGGRRLWNFCSSRPVFALAVRSAPAPLWLSHEPGVARGLDRLARRLSGRAGRAICLVAPCRATILCLVRRTTRRPVVGPSTHQREA